MALNYSNITKYISSARLQKYELVCSGDHKKTLKLYQTNLRLSQAFYPILSLFEVVFRNAINEAMTSYFSDPNWLENQISGFMNDSTLKSSNPRHPHNEFMKKSVRSAIHKSGSHLHHKIVAELKFGFWTSFFDPKHYRLLAGRPISIFTTLPSGTNRSNILDKINRIRDFRNRIYHNEPVVFKKDTNGIPYFTLECCQNAYDDILDIFKWLNLDFNCWTKRINNVPFEIQRADCMKKYYPRSSYHINRILIGLRHYRRKYFPSIKNDF